MPAVKPKRVSNYELFFDLVFVLAISNLTRILHRSSFVLQDLLVYIAAFIGILSVWFFTTFYMNKFARIDRNDVYGIIALMFIVGQMAINMTVEPTTQVFLIYQILYALAYGTILILYVLNGRRYGFDKDMPYNMKLLAGVVLFHTVHVILVLLGWMQMSRLVFLYPLLPLFFLISTRPKNLRRPNFPHMVERCQLITIISFGEMVIALIRNYPLQHFFLESLIFFFGMAFLFIMYISQTFLNMDHHQNANAQKLVYSHITLLMGINLITIALEKFPEHLNQLAIIYFIVGLVLYYLSLLSNSAYNKDEFQISQRQYLTYLAILAVFLLLIWIFQKQLILIALLFAGLTYSMAHVGYLYRQAARRRLEAQEKARESNETPSSKKD